ncbi:uncharacterized protein ca [Anabrus simplex]|uniref:uncharacterized protein ca n=1 Tax=Anabrus simplex TaxID=316456 RepID=UPI0035A2F58D
MASSTEEGTSSSPDQQLFELQTLFTAKNINLSARSEVGRRQLLAFVTGSGDLSLHYLSDKTGEQPIMKLVPWYTDSSRRITCMCFDPSGTWLLIAGYDSSLFIIPALAIVDSSAVLDHRWSTTDVTPFFTTTSVTINGSCSKTYAPVAIVWWQSLQECQHTAVVGNERGDIMFISLTTGSQLGITYIKSPITSLHICQDNSLDTVFLLITDDSRNQWKLLLEQRATGYTWPVENGSNNKGGGSSSLDLSSSQSSVDLEFGSRTASHYPTARSRLQGLKQLSVEKLASLRQKLAETRSKGVTSVGNSNTRRESSSSSSDETASISHKRNSSSASDSSHITTGPSPERLCVQVGETYLHPQYMRGRYLLSGYYAPSSILTIHGMSMEIVPLFVHKLPPDCRDVLATDRFLYVTAAGGKQLLVVSNQLSESRLDGDTEHNPESVIETYTFRDNEEVLSIYKCSVPNYQRHDEDTSGENEKDNSDDKKNYRFAQPKELKPFKPAKVEVPPIDSCIVVTNQGVYKVHVRRPATEVFLELVLKHQELEKAERLALIFGLNLQELLEHAGDHKLAAREFPQAIALYKLSRCRHLKSVLKFAAAGHSAELLSYIKVLFSTSGLDLTASEKIHLSNLAVMSYTEQVLRNMTGKIVLFKQFLKFLKENLFYDEVLAVNVAGQTGLWEVLQFLATYRGLHQEVLDILTKILRSHSDPKVVEAIVSKQAPGLDSGLWLCVTDPSLQQSLLAKPQQARIHLHFVDLHLPYLEQFALQRLAALYDPSSPAFHFSLRRTFKVLRSRQSSESGSSYVDSVDLMDAGLSEEFLFPMEHLIQSFLLVLLYLMKKQLSDPSYNSELMKKIVLPKEQEIEDGGDISPTVPLQVNHLSSGFSHVALIRNGSVYTWGGAVQGCLGTGPTMSRYGAPQPVSLFSSLMLEVSSVSCGRQHTLALTNNGVYAWGSSQFGQLGIGKTVQSPYPRLVEGLAQERIMAVSCGQYHSMALAHDGRVFTWGWGVHGQLGHGSVEDVHHPTLVKQLAGKVVMQISGGHGHTIVLTSDGQVFTFGSSVFGQLGNGTNVKSSVPVLVTALTEPIKIVATGYFHNLAVSCSNKLYTWGSSPQVLRLQAQAQKKARLLQNQQDSKPLSPVTETSSSSEISNSSSSEKDCDSSSSSQSGNNPVDVDKTSLGCSRSTPSSTIEHSKALKARLSLDKSILSNSANSEASNLSQNTFALTSIGKSPSLLVVEDLSTEEHTDSSSHLQQEDELELKTSFSPTLPTIAVSPTVEYKGLSAPSLGTNNANPAGRNSRQQPARWDGDESQAHLFPQLVDTNLVNGTIAQISCGCHHSALLTKEGELYIWGRNLDGQVGNGSRKEVPIPTPMSSTPSVSMKSPTSISGVIPSAAGSLRLQQVCCGCEFTTALEASGGKVWAWGNNSQAQLGVAPAEDSKPLEGKMVMLKTSKRVIKLPHGMHNSCDVPREVPNLPASTIVFQAGSGESRFTNERWPEGSKGNLCPPLCSIEQPCYGPRTLHYAFQKFHGHYDSKLLLNKCLELENFQAAAKLATLDRHYHLALAYQLKAIALAMLGGEGKYTGSNIQDVNDTGKKHNPIILDTQLSKKDSSEMDIKGNLSYQHNNRENANIELVNQENLKHIRKSGTHHSKDVPIESKDASPVKGNHEESVSIDDSSPSRSHLTGESRSQSISSTPDSLTSLNNPDENEMHTFAIQGGREQMSEDNNRCLITTPEAEEKSSSDGGKVTTQKDDSSSSVSSEDQCTVYSNSLGEDHKNPNIEVKTSVEGRRLVAHASVVVEYYVSVMEEDSHTMMSQLLQQGFEFWLSHSLPVDRLENLLLKHMPKFFYPLGLLLFCKDRVNEKDAEADKCLLNHLSTRFCLQLCSMLLGHVDQRKAYPDYIELLAKITAMHVGPIHGVNGCYQGPSQTPEQLMEAILQKLGGSTDMGDTVEQSYINLSHEGICGADHIPGSCPDQLFVFSCGHRYGSEAFKQTVLPEMESGLLQLHHPLPHTARLLRGVFSTSTPSIHLACPRCLLGHLQAQASA